MPPIRLMAHEPLEVDIDAVARVEEFVDVENLHGKGVSA